MMTKAASNDLATTTAATAIIPARYHSTRFPGKMLACETGKPLIQHVYERVLQAKCVRQIMVATDDDRIAQAVKSFGGNVYITHNDHPNGTSRIAEVAQTLDESHTLIVNVQGDEPEIEPEVIDQLIQGLARDPHAPMATLASDFMPDEDPTNSNIVKLIVNQNNHAMYFSRALIPFDRDGIGVTLFKHPGMYAYRRAFLIHYATLAPTPLEQAEKLEQLRALEHGYQIAVVHVNCQHHGIDTPEQYAAFVKRMKNN